MVEGEPVRVWLTMAEDRKGVLTGQPPIIARVQGTRRQGVYPQPGDWLLVRGLCEEGVTRVLGYLPVANEPVAVELEMRPSEARNVERHAARA